ncbi:MAG TPA: hypothetical protein VE643_03395, partial [Nitrososphaeraceae archaeon]|nr:hypothetical protein [Nitrososphaeraceae archaeon]
MVFVVVDKSKSPAVSETIIIALVTFLFNSFLFSVFSYIKDLGRKCYLMIIQPKFLRIMVNVLQSH